MDLKRTISTGIAALAGLAVVLGAGGCRGERSDNPPRQFFPDMDDQPRWNPQSQSPFFADGRTMRPRVQGVVAYGRGVDPSDASRASLLKKDAAFYRGVDERGEPLDYMPASAVEAFRRPGQDAAAALAAMIERGRERYNITCAVCHGYDGEGKGTVGVRWSYPLPSYYDPKYTDRSQPTGKDGHLFDVIRNGLVDQTGAQKMPAYGHAMSEADSWAIVAYLRTLQASRTTDLESIPAAKKQELERSRGAARPASHANAGSQEGNR